MKYNYTGIFFHKALTDNGKLDTQIACPHVTHKYKPTEVNKSLFGQEVMFKVVGYGINEENEGLLVEVAQASDEMREALAEIEVPHITLSISKEGKAVNTRYLNFEPCTPWYLSGFYGGFNKGKVFYKQGLTNIPKQGIIKP